MHENMLKKFFPFIHMFVYMHLYNLHITNSVFLDGLSMNNTQEERYIFMKNILQILSIYELYHFVFFSSRYFV